MGGETGDKTAILLRKLATGFAAVFGFVTKAAETPSVLDAATRLAVQRTDLALDRTYLAAERTLMGWIRTALSMISFGFTLGKLGEALQNIEVKGLLIERTLSVRSMAYFLVVLGTFGLLVATVQFRLRSNKLQEMGLRRQFSIAYTIGVLLTVVGGFALTALVMKL